MTTTNKLAGHGQHIHSVPSVPGLIVEIRDGHHDGTSVWQREGHGFYFASHDAESLQHADRCVFVVGQDADELVGGVPHGCDLSTPRGSFLIGVATADDLSWLSDGAEVLWDSAAPV